MVRHYETMVVFDGTLPEDVLEKEQKQVEELISKHAQFERTDVWGKRPLAYPIKKKKTGYYCLFLFSGSGDIENAIDKQLKLNENVLRHLTVLRNLRNEEARKIFREKGEDASKVGFSYEKYSEERENSMQRENE
ncbi:MAG: 30S ribosomal protein S6 [Chitinispirillaceae bacterium]|nr:30S ribosomal protein S6 [Chitinispirillaceae bacterium]